MFRHPLKALTVSLEMKGDVPDCVRDDPYFCRLFRESKATKDKYRRKSLIREISARWCELVAEEQAAASKAHAEALLQ